MFVRVAIEIIRSTLIMRNIAKKYNRETVAWSVCKVRKLRETQDVTGCIEGIQGN